MRRKFDIRNKRSFIVIMVLAIVFIIIFSLFIVKYTNSLKVGYVVETSSVLNDSEGNTLVLSEDATLKVKWNGNYYLKYQDKNINLGKKVIIYNEVTGRITLYGVFYKIDGDGNVTTLKDETVIDNSTNTGFYKLEDRKYLAIDRTIYTKDKNLQTNNYLLIELDKLGNAKLSNNKVNLKTLKETSIVTSAYTFDIANEIINFGKKDIDLKKIIGSTNAYSSSEPSSSGGISGNGTGTGGGTGNGEGTGGGAEGGTGTGGGISQGDVINPGEDGEITDIEDIKNKTKVTSIIRVAEGITNIDVDYVIYDPYDEYKSVYVEVLKEGKIEVIYLSKNNETLSINGLNPDTTYNMKFIYTYIDKDNNLVKETFDEINAKTLMPSYSVSVYKLSKITNILTYKVNLQSGFNVSRVDVNLSFNYNYVNPDTSLVEIKKASIDGYVLVNEGEQFKLGTFDISGYDIDDSTLLSLTLKSVVYGDRTLLVNNTYTFSFGR